MRYGITDLIKKIAQGEDCQIPGDRQFGRMSQRGGDPPDPFALFLILHVRNQEEDRCGDQDAQYAVNDISDFETVGIISQRIGDNGQYHVLQHQGHDGVCNIGHSKEPALLIIAAQHFDDFQIGAPVEGNGCNAKAEEQQCQHHKGTAHGYGKGYQRRRHAGCDDKLFRIDDISNPAADKIAGDSGAA